MKLTMESWRFHAFLFPARFPASFPSQLISNVRRQLESGFMELWAASPIIRRRTVTGTGIAS